MLFYGVTDSRYLVTWLESLRIIYRCWNTIRWSHTLYFEYFPKLKEQQQLHFHASQNELWTERQLTSHRITRATATSRWPQQQTGANGFKYGCEKCQFPHMTEQSPHPYTDYHAPTRPGLPQETLHRPTVLLGKVVHWRSIIQDPLRSILGTIQEAILKHKGRGKQHSDGLCVCVCFSTMSHSFGWIKWVSRSCQFSLCLH